MPTFAQLKIHTRENLNDAGVIVYSATDLNDSFQDIYDDIIAQTQASIKKVTLDWVANLSYYDFSVLVSDYIACVAIYNNVNKSWLEDNVTLRDLDQIDDKWEIRNSTPGNWAALDHRRVGVFPKYSSAAGTFDLYYWAKAETIIDSASPLILVDVPKLLSEGSTADLLESYEEFTKANIYWNSFNNDLMEFKERVKNLVKSDLLIKI